jgi:hypothetical protein
LYLTERKKQEDEESYILWGFIIYRPALREEGEI